MTAVQNPPPLPTPAAAGKDPAAAESPLVRSALTLASMKLTVVLLLLLGVLTLFGTFAQRDLDVYTVQKRFFESWFAVYDTGWPLFGHELRIPLPGGLLLISVLFVNLVVGGLARLRWSLRNSGILITHFGIALLLFASFVKMQFSFAGMVQLWEGEQTAAMVSFHEYELALIRRDGEAMVERTVPAAALVGAGAEPVRIDDPALPFVLAVTHWMHNCNPSLKGPMFDAPTPVVTDAPRDGDGAGGDKVFLRPLPIEELELQRNVPGCYVEVAPRSGGEARLGALYGARWMDGRARPFTFEVDGQEWGLDLRRVHWDLPFAVRLDDFKKTDHPGTMSPRDYSSWVTVFEAGQPAREAHIYMNNPLRKEGYVFYQTNWGPQPPQSGPPWYSVFEVAKNPSDKWPELASYVVLIGLLLHFVPKLLRYLSSSTRQRSLPEMS